MPREPMGTNHGEGRKGVNRMVHRRITKNATGGGVKNFGRPTKKGEAHVKRV